MAIAIVGQFTYANTVATSATTGSRTTTAGNGILVVVHALNAVQPRMGTTDVTDSKGNTYTRLHYVNQTEGVNYNAVGIYYCANPSSMGASHTVTYTDANTVRIVIVALEISGQDTAGGVDATGSAHSGGTPTLSPSSGTSGTTAQADELAIAAFTGDSGFNNITARPSGYTAIQESTSGESASINFGSAYKILGSTGTTGGTWTLDSSSIRWGGIVATIKAAAAVATGMGWANAKGGWW